LLLILKIKNICYAKRLSKVICFYFKTKLREWFENDLIPNVIKIYIGLADLWATEGLEHDQDNVDWNEYEK